MRLVLGRGAMFLLTENAIRGSVDLASLTAWFGLRAIEEAPIVARSRPPRVESFDLFSTSTGWGLWAAV